MGEEKNILHGPPFNYEFPPGTTMGNLLFDQIKNHGTKTAQIQKETGEKITYDEIFKKSVKLATYFRENGIKVNDRIGICSPNSLGWAPTICATLFVGATLCPLNHMYTENELKHTLSISKPKYIFVSASVLKKVQICLKEASWSTKLVVMLKEPNTGIPCIDSLVNYIPDSVLDNFEVTNVNVREHIISILCSSGTTGLPKGVMLTDRNYLTNLQNMLDGSTGMAGAGQVIICLLPFFHAYCFTVLIMGLIAGAEEIIFAQFQEDAFLETIEKHKIEVLSLVPPLMVFLAKHPIVDKYDLSSLKVIWCGAAPLSPSVEEAVKKRLNNPEIRQGYGMTETTLSVVKVPENCNKPGTVGKLLSGCSAKVLPVDEDGSSQNEPLGPYKPGELCFKGDFIMKGYCGDVSSTSATIDKDGWLHTGDVGYYDEDGYFFIVDRIKELIKFKGFQVPPAELEAILLTHPEIKDAAVVGLPDEQAGELPIAFVAKQPNARLTAEDVIKYVDERVSNQKRLRGGVRFLDTIPKNPSGKILRRELRAMLKSKL